jgi:formate dehydrogenase maturation protein FdhE
LEAENSMIEKHEQVINKDILPRLAAVEKMQASFEKEVSTIKQDLAAVQKGQISLEKGQIALENTVMKDGKETRELLKPFADHYLNELKEEAETKKDIKIKQLDTREKIIIGLFSGVLGTGGLTGLVLGIMALVK